MNILLVEPDPHARNALCTQLEELGHHAVCVADGDEAMRLLPQHKCELVLSNGEADRRRPPTLSTRIRTAPELSETYIVLYFHSAEELGAAASDNMDPDDVLVFPLRGDELRTRLRTAARFLHHRHVAAEQKALLSRLIEKLGSALGIVQSDLRAASEIQLSLLPTESHVHPSVEVDWLVLPSSFLCGDNLNYFVVQNDYLIFYHLDVAGHGIPSALLSVTLNQLLSPQPGSPMMRFDPSLDLKRVIPPVDVVKELNARFLPQGDSYFTIIYGIFDLKTRQVSMCQAGHPTPLRTAADGAVTPIGDGGFPVGLWPGITYEETTTVLEPGQKLVLYSDGLLSCLNRQGAHYSLDRLKKLLSNMAACPCGDLLQAVQRDIESWTEGRMLPDDISILILESKAV